MITESFNGSSVGLNGTSLEDIKELTLNMKVPTSINKKTKTQAEANGQHARDIMVREQQETEQIDEIAEEDTESNYVTNGSYA